MGRVINGARIPDYALAEAVNGDVFFDIYGEFTGIREKLLHMPEDIRRKRIAGNILTMAQSWQYNFNRCIRHGEPETAGTQSLLSTSTLR